MNIKFLLLSTLLLSTLSASSWGDKNNQESWTSKHKQSNWDKKNKRSLNSRNYTKNTKNFGSISEKEMEKVNIYSKDIINKKVNEKKGSARERLAEMQKCEKEAKDKEAKKRCWLSKKQLKFNSKMTAKSGGYKTNYDKELKALQNKYKKQLNQDPSNRPKLNYTPNWNNIKFPKNKGDYNGF